MSLRGALWLLAICLSAIAALIRIERRRRSEHICAWCGARAGKPHNPGCEGQR